MTAKKVLEGVKTNGKIAPSRLAYTLAGSDEPVVRSQEARLHIVAKLT